MYKYIHDVGNRVVYQMPSEPTVREKMDGHGKRIGWSAEMEIVITRADNKLNGNQWQHATSSYPNQHLDAHYTKEHVISYFLMHHAPHGEAISQEQYAGLQAQYEAIARGQSGDY